MDQTRRRLTAKHAGMGILYPGRKQSLCVARSFAVAALGERKLHLGHRHFFLEFKGCTTPVPIALSKRQISAFYSTVITLSDTQHFHH
jgi:hypothetical protein